MKYSVSFELEFRKHNYPGRLIAIEGIDGSGKTTQVRKAVEILKEKGVESVYTKEPTDGEIGKLIRRILVGEKKFEPASFQYLFSADRVEHQEEIFELLKKGKIVVSDRYFWSSVPYGALDRGI
ncbi:MAG: dTMP kinase, partial [Candidatus Levybacteria bacterium]|nr:dTMP kinase [Candidatus Levybacteria bacterium]